MRRVALEPAGRSSENIKVARSVPGSNFVSTGASSAPEEATRRVAGPRFSTAAALKVTILVVFTTSRLTMGKGLYKIQVTLCALDFHKSAKLLLLEVRPDGEVVMSRTYVCGKTVVIPLGRHGGRDWCRRVVKK